MQPRLKIAGCDVLQGDNVVVTLSDSRVFVITLDQILAQKPESIEELPLRHDQEPAQ